MDASIPQAEKDRLIALGSTGIMREIAEGKHCQPTAPYRDAVDALLASVKASEEAAAFARAEAREERMLSISDSALSIAKEDLAAARSSAAAAREQARWAMYAAIAAVIALIINITLTAKGV